MGPKNIEIKLLVRSEIDIILAATGTGSFLQDEASYVPVGVYMSYSSLSDRLVQCSPTSHPQKLLSTLLEFRR